MRRFFAVLECGRHGESPFQSPLYHRETTQPVHTLSIRFCIRRPHVVLDSGYPLLHKSSSEEHNKRSGTLKQDSRTQLLSLNSNLPFHTCGPFFNTHPNTLRTFGSLVITRAQRQDAQVLCSAGKRGTRRIPTIELTSCAKKAIVPKKTCAISSLIRNHMLCPHLVHSLLYKPKCKGASCLQSCKAEHVANEQDSTAYSL